MSRYALVGAVSGELLSLSGLVLTHGDAAELEFLFPGARVVALPPHIPPERTVSISAHPEMSSVRFPLDRRDFQ